MTTASMTNSKPADAAVATVAEPIVIDLGKKTRRQVRKLRRGKPSRLMDRVQEVLAKATAANAIPAGSQAVIIVVREKKRKTKYGKMWGMG